MACSPKLEKRLVANQDPKNPIVILLDSGARGATSQTSHSFLLICVVYGCTQTVVSLELPILGSIFREGLSVPVSQLTELRKGMTDTALLRQPDSGYLTRRFI